MLLLSSSKKKLLMSFYRSQSETCRSCFLKSICTGFSNFWSWLIQVTYEKYLYNTFKHEFQWNCFILKTSKCTSIKRCKHLCMLFFLSLKCLCFVLYMSFLGSNFSVLLPLKPMISTGVCKLFISHHYFTFWNFVGSIVATTFIFHLEKK